MGFDIGIGRCIAISATAIDVHVDNSVVHKFFPQLPWQREGTSVMRVPPQSCSIARPPQVGEEVFLSGAALDQHHKGWLDVEGDGSFRPVNLSAISRDMKPGVVAAPIAKARWR